ncbi:MAG: cardiolipin synthase [Clostridiales bacterium]|nr:cardiolipin synthase [Clostridiales bacterium]
MKRRHSFKKALARRLLVAVLLAVQLALLVFVILSGNAASKWISIALSLISILVCLHVISAESRPGFKIIWLLLVLIFPVFGGLFYLIATRQTGSIYAKKHFNKIRSETLCCFDRDPFLSERAKDTFPALKPMLHYLGTHAGFPVSAGPDTRYYPSGETFFAALLDALEQAEKYIFLEYFIIEEGIMWDAVLDVLKRKAAAGLDVRVMFDDMGCFLTLPREYPAFLRSHGIKCHVFMPFLPILSVLHNNRDHRKIASVDGKVAFTGGVNLADEYINARKKHGRWRDAAVRVTGSAAWNLTLIFLTLWRFTSGETDDPVSLHPEPTPAPHDAQAFVQPYADVPLDAEKVGEQVYLHIIQAARDYLYISTPYLIIDDTMMLALTLAAKSGVDVRILTPEVGDNKFVHMTTRSYYGELIAAGVKIYEYTGGYNHAKTFAADDRVATVGTVNLDYRSLYLHYECGTVFYGGDIIRDMKEDFLRTAEDSTRIMEEDCAVSGPMQLFQSILRIFAPLM